MTDAARVLEMVVSRFLCRRATDLTWVVSPKAEPWARLQGVALTSALEFAPDDEWQAYRDLSKCEMEVHRNHDLFADAMVRLVRELPDEVNRYAGSVRGDEFRILLVYAGREVYDFFARDHRFGAPPRGKMYGSNLRRGYKTERERAKRPDVALLALKRKIGVHRALEMDDVEELEVELARREEVVRIGGDPMAGIRPARQRHVQEYDADKILEHHRKMLGISKVGP